MHKHQGAFTKWDDTLEFEPSTAEVLSVRCACIVHVQVPCACAGALSCHHMKPAAVQINVIHHRTLMKQDHIIGHVIIKVSELQPHNNLV